MDTERMIRQLKHEANKHRYDTLRTFDTNITALCSDVIPKLEQLKQYEAIGTVEECCAARERKQAKKPLLGGNPDMPDSDIFICPACSGVIGINKVRVAYCADCGQAIDWSEEK